MKISQHHTSHPSLPAGATNHTADSAPIGSGAKEHSPVCRCAARPTGNGSLHTRVVSVCSPRHASRQRDSLRCEEYLRYHPIEATGASLVPLNGCSRGRTDRARSLYISVYEGPAVSPQRPSDTSCSGSRRRQIGRHGPCCAGPRGVMSPFAHPRAPSTSQTNAESEESPATTAVIGSFRMVLVRCSARNAEERRW